MYQSHSSLHLLNFFVLRTLIGPQEEVRRKTTRLVSNIRFSLLLNFFTYYTNVKGDKGEEEPSV